MEATKSKHIALARRDDLGRAYALLCDQAHDDVHEFVALATSGRVHHCVATDSESARQILETAFGRLRQLQDLGPLPNESRFICDK